MALIIELTDNLAIKKGALSWDLCKKRMVKNRKTGDMELAWSPEKFYCSWKSLMENLPNDIAFSVDANSMSELMDEMSVVTRRLEPLLDLSPRGELVEVT